MRVLYLHLGGEWLAGGERSLLTLLEHARDTVQCHVVANAQTLIAACRDRQIPATFAPLSGIARLRHIVTRTSRWCRSLSTIGRQIRIFRPHVIHANNLWPCQLAVVAGRLYGIPVVCHVRESVKTRRFRAASLRRWGKAVIAISEAVAGPYRATRHAAPVFVVYNPISVHHPAKAPQARADGRVCHLAVAGRFSSEKGVDRAIRLVAWLFRNGFDVKLSVYGKDYNGDYGKGCSFSELQSIVRNEGIGDRVRFCGFVDSLDEHLSQADVLLVPSRSEGLGRVVVEAGLTGTPSVACRVGGLPETMVDGETGMLVDDFESDAERGRILTYLRNKPLQQEMGRAAREFCRIRFDPIKVTARTLAVYRYALGERSLEETMEEMA